jgi:hypothetical protein
MDVHVVKVAAAQWQFSTNSTNDFSAFYRNRMFINESAHVQKIVTQKSRQWGLN